MKKVGKKRRRIIDHDDSSDDEKKSRKKLKTNGTSQNVATSNSSNAISQSAKAADSSILKKEILGGILPNRVRSKNQREIKEKSEETPCFDLIFSSSSDDEFVLPSQLKNKNSNFVDLDEDISIVSHTYKKPDAPFKLSPKDSQREKNLSETVTKRKLGRLQKCHENLSSCSMSDNSAQAKRASKQVINLIDDEKLFQEDEAKCNVNVDLKPQFDIVSSFDDFLYSISPHKGQNSLSSDSLSRPHKGNAVDKSERFFTPKKEDKQKDSTTQITNDFLQETSPKFGTKRRFSQVSSNMDLSNRNLTTTSECPSRSDSDSANNRMPEIFQSKKLSLLARLKTALPPFNKPSSSAATTRVSAGGDLRDGSTFKQSSVDSCTSKSNDERMNPSVSKVPQASDASEVKYWAFSLVLMKVGDLITREIE